MPQKDNEKAQESRDKLGYLGTSENTKVTPEQNEENCCHSDHCKKQEEEDISVEEAVKILNEAIPRFLRNYSDEFHVYEPFWHAITSSKTKRDVLNLSGEVSGDGYFLQWSLGLWMGCPPELKLTIKHTGGIQEITWHHTQRETYYANLIASGALSPKAIKALYDDLTSLKRYDNSDRTGMDKWAGDIQSLILEETGMDKNVLLKITRHFSDLHRLYGEKRTFVEGIRKAIEALEDTKSITKSPTLKQIRQDLEDVLNGRNKHAYEFYNN